MGIISQINFSFLNTLFKEKEFRFNKLEFERELGIVDDAFYLTLETDGGPVVIKIVTNLRCVRHGRVVLRYHDLFINAAGKKISKSEYRSQKEIKKTALQTNLDLVNDLFSKKPVKAIAFSQYGDLRISLSNTEFIIANDNLDISKSGRRLYEVLFLNFVEPFGIIVSEHKRMAKVIKVTTCTLFPEKNECGLRFILNAK